MTECPHKFDIHATLPLAYVFPHANMHTGLSNWYVWVCVFICGHDFGQFETQVGLLLLLECTC